MKSPAHIAINPMGKVPAIRHGSYERVLDTLSSLLCGRVHVAGDRFSTADLFLAAHLNWGMMTGAIEKRPEFEDYRDAQINRQAAVRALVLARDSLYAAELLLVGVIF